MERIDNHARATTPPMDWHARNDVWRGRRSNATLPAVATGYPELDRWLPARGWPLGGLCEILHEADGTGELSLLLPALTRMASAQRPIVWIVPPYQPHAPALRQRQLALDGLRLVRSEPGQALWAAEQCLRAGCCAAVLVWPEHATANALRRLQLAAESGRCHGFVFRDTRHLAQPSPAPLRLSVRREHGRLQVRFDKCRGLLTPPAGFIDVAAACSDDMPSPDDRQVRTVVSIAPETGSGQPAVCASVPPLRRATRISRIDPAANEDPASAMQAVATDLFDTASLTPAVRSEACVAAITDSDIVTMIGHRKSRQAETSGTSPS